MLTLIGSAAAQHWYPEFREPKDADWHSNEDPKSFYSPRVQGVDIFVDERLGEWPWGYIAKPAELYTMKVSHAFWEIENTWDKHMNDVLFFQNKGVPFIRELYDILVPIWKDLHGRKITNLRQGAGTFFKDAVERIYDHDSIHASVAYYDRPMYESILLPGEEVMVDNDKFWAMDWEEQIKLVREEVYATALERIMIPNNYDYSPMAAYAWALRRTITSLFKGEWALYAVLNYSTLVRPDCNYVQRHLDNKDKLIRLG